MRIYRAKLTVSSDRTITIEKLPFQAGDRVEVTVRSLKSGSENGECYPLRGKPFRYIDPFGSVAETDWNAY